MQYAGGDDMSDRVKVEGIFEKGYGLSPKLVMQDEHLSIEAKAIYAYISSFAGNGTSAFPSISRVCKDLNISKNRFLRHRKQLVEQGYINIEKNRKGGQFKNNTYVINHTVASKRNHVVPNHRHGKLPPRQNEATNNNNIFNNNSSLISSSSTRDPDFEKVMEFYQANLQRGVSETPYNLERLVALYDEFNHEVLLAGMKVAAEAEKKGISFLDGVLKNWREAGVKSLEDARRYEREFRESRKRNNGSNVVNIKGGSNLDTRNYADSVGDHGIKLYK